MMIMNERKKGRESIDDERQLMRKMDSVMMLSKYDDEWKMIK